MAVTSSASAKGVEIVVCRYIQDMAEANSWRLIINLKNGQIMDVVSDWVERPLVEYAGDVGKVPTHTRP